MQSNYNKEFNLAKEEFLKFIDSLDLKNISTDNQINMINRKVKHTLKVVLVIEELCKRMNLSDEQLYLAKIIALLHDIGRFEEALKTSSYFGSRIDHAKLGVDLLFEDKNYIRKFIESNNYDNIIKKAIENHNKLNIPDDLTAEEEFYCKLIRDADKIDIYRVKIEDEKNIMSDIISEKVLYCFQNYKQVNSEYVKNYSDDIMRCLCFLFDINFNESLDYIKEHNLIENFIDTIKLEDNKFLYEMKNNMLKYLNNK